MPVTSVRSRWSSGSLVFENLSGTELMTISSTGVNIPTFTIDSLTLDSGATVDLNGIADSFILDADADTTISAPTDDQIDIEIAGADDFTFTANTFTALSGSSIATDTIVETTAASGVTVDTLLIKDGGITLIDGQNILISGTTTGASFGNAITDKISFYGVTPVAQAAGANQAALTNSTGGSADGTLAAVGDTSMGDESAAINNNFTDIHTLLNELRTALVNVGIIKGSA